MDGHRLAAIGFEHRAGGIVDPVCRHAVEGRASVEHRIDEGHESPMGCRGGVVVNDDRVAGPEQRVRHRRADIAGAANEAAGHVGGRA